MVLRRLRVPLAILMASAALALLVRVPVDTLLREPLALMWWLIDSLPQQLIWGMLTVIGFLMAFSLTRGPRNDRPESAVASALPETRVQQLTQLILLAENSGWARDVMGRSLRETAAALRALREGIPLDLARQALREGRWLNQQSFAAVPQPHREEEQTLSDSYADDLGHTLDAMERYAHGGPLEAS